ncbi:MAG: DHHW family protein [Eubacteriales bacterium]
MQVPDFSFHAFFSGEWSEDIETYITDQFFMRDTFVTLKSSTEQLLGKVENNDVYLSTEDTLIEKFIITDYNQIDKNLSAIQNFTDTISNTSIPVYFAFIPTASEIYADQLPANAPVSSQLEILQYVENTIDNTISPYETLIAHNDEYIYYGTDHHWTSLGSYYASGDILSSMGKSQYSLDYYTPTIQSQDFYGTLYAKSGIRGIEADTITTYTENVDIEIVDGTEVFTGNLYEIENLSLSDKYTVFLGGNYPHIKICGNGEGTLLLIKDSFANSLVPFLIDHYETIHMVDLRFNRNSMSEFIIDNAVTQVLFCYSIPNFSSDTNLIWLQ